jgi:hypothetical protein
MTDYAHIDFRCKKENMIFNLDYGEGENSRILRDRAWQGRGGRSAV